MAVSAIWVLPQRFKLLDDGRIDLLQRCFAQAVPPQLITRKFNEARSSSLVNLAVAMTWNDAGQPTTSV